MNLHCDESMEPLQVNHCEDPDTHEARLCRAADLCRARQEGTDAARRAVQHQFSQALDARRLQVDAERAYRELQQQRDLVNSMIEGFSGTRVRRSDFRRLEHLTEDARRDNDTANRNADEQQHRVADAELAAQSCADSHERNCDFCCFRVFCTGCGVQLR